jgi:O-antigen/teichoic acid export membrane protein
MVFLIPLEAVDELLVNLFASLTSSRAIFVRRHLLGPGLRLLVVLLLVFMQREVTFVAYGYVAATALGVTLSCGVLRQLFRRHGLLAHLGSGRPSVPLRELVMFTVPLLTADLSSVVMHLGSVFLLERFGGPAEVALLRAVLPAAHMNEVVVATFALLYMPSAARLFARADYASLNRLYSATALWMAVATVHGAPLW